MNNFNDESHFIDLTAIINEDQQIKNSRCTIKKLFKKIINTFIPYYYRY